MNAHTHAADAARWASVLEDAAIENAPLRSMQALARCNQSLIRCAAELVEQGVAAGLTQRQMAAALDVPEHVLRGARRNLGGKAARS